MPVVITVVCVLSWFAVVRRAEPTSRRSGLTRIGLPLESTKSLNFCSATVSESIDRAEPAPVM
jgi:hypothetical protein